MEFSPSLPPHGAEDSADSFLDGLFNYDVGNPIRNGRSSTVYSATCKRGRLHGRIVALKKVSLPTFVHLTDALALHQSLCHPSIVSLLSVFSTSSACYHVLEHCSRGTLQDILLSRNPCVLSEPAIRGVLRSIIPALVYLHNESILHRDINPANILINESFRAKLSGFTQAVRLSDAKASVDICCGSKDYRAPEVVEHAAYSFPADIWSLGSTVVTCLAGTPVVIDPSTLEIDYKLSGNTSEEARSLLASLLHVEPSKRLEARQIMSHSFFDSSLPVVQLSDNTQTGVLSSHRPALPTLNMHARPRYPKSLSSSSVRITPRTNSAPPLSSQPRFLAPPNGLNMRDHLRHYLNPHHISAAALPGRRVYSAPTRPPIIDSALDTQRILAEYSAASSDDEADDDSSIQGDALLQHPLLRLSPVKMRLTKEKSDPPGIMKPTTTTTVLKSNVPRCASSSLANFDHTSPMTSWYLTPQTHKVGKGQITVLPSASLLIDFREGERRSGRKGTEVLCVNSEGNKVEIYSAPHLSTPCCLVEPTSTFLLSDLPASYRRQYNEASRIVEQLKQRIPKLILHRPEAKYVVMANDPLGDVEIITPPPSEARTQGTRNEEGRITLTSDSMRIRYSRRSQSVELSRYTAPETPGPTTAGQWIKKIIRVTNTGGAELHFVDTDTTSLTFADWEGLRLLDNFLPLCDSVTNWGKNKNLNHANMVATGREESQRRQLAETLSSPEYESRGATANCSSILTQTHPPKRPRSSLVSSTNTLTGPPYKDSQSGSACESLPFSSTTKFVPAVGWCTRSQSLDQDPQYKILFLDGVSLEVNVGDGSVELIRPDGTADRCLDGAWDRLPVVKDKMRVFGKVVDSFSSGVV